MVLGLKVCAPLIYFFFPPFGANADPELAAFPVNFKLAPQHPFPISPLVLIIVEGQPSVKVFPPPPLFKVFELPNLKKSSVFFSLFLGRSPQFLSIDRGKGVHPFLVPSPSTRPVFHLCPTLLHYQ